MNEQKNFVESSLFNNLKNYLFDLSTPWYRQIGTTRDDAPDMIWFSHCFYNYARPDCQAYELIIPILDKLGSRAPLRVQANLVRKTVEPIRSHWHTDFEYKDSFTSILYMNTCNGPTVFKSDNIKVMAEENKMITFNTSNEHAGITQTDVEERIVINFNYF